MKKMSLCKNEESVYSKDWFVKDIKDQEELIEVIKNNAYSNAYFKDNRRSQENIIGYHNQLILDIDNDETDFTIADCKKVLKQKGIQALILPSRSHLKSKNGLIKERYRVFCELDQPIPADISKELYREMMALIVKDLDMSTYVDIEQFKSVSSRWQNALLEALQVAKNREEFLNKLIKNVNFSCINIHRDKEDVIYIAGKKYHISDFSLQNYKSKQDIIKQFQRNRLK